ncbi:TPA: hypothetical protein ACL05J_002134 [Listeria monocytogenes]
MSIKVYEKDKIFQRATVAGWRPMQGTQINIQGIDFAFCPSKKIKMLLLMFLRLKAAR